MSEELCNFRVEGHNSFPECAKVFVNDVPVRCTGYEVKHNACSLPVLTLYSNPETIIEEKGTVEWVANPTTIREAFIIIRTAVDKGQISIVDLAKFIAEGNVG